MSPPLLHFISRRWRFAGLVLIAASSGFAQVATPPSETKKIDPVLQAQQAVDLANYRVGASNALALAKTNNLAAAEVALVALNKAKPNTAAWHMETAQRLMQLAEQLARAGQPGNIAALANSALQHLAQAQPLAPDAHTKAAAKSLEGSIHERYLANPAAALASYQGAAQLSPTTAAKAKEAADRLQKTDDNLRAKSGGK